MYMHMYMYMYMYNMCMYVYMYMHGSKLTRVLPLVVPPSESLCFSTHK